jgi:hypothetical protein
MRYRFTLVPLLGLVLPTLVALAHASPPDETWLPGIYDDADFDDVVTLITVSSGAPPDAPADVLRPGSVAAFIMVFSGRASAFPTTPAVRRPPDIHRTS